MTERLHLAGLLDDMRRLGEAPAVVEHRGVRRFVTGYAALARGADRFAAEIVRRGIEPGERVLLWGENSAAWIACFFGCVQRGVLAVPLDASGSVEFAARIAAETKPRLIVGDPLLLRSLATHLPAGVAPGQVPGQIPGQLSLAEIDAAMRSRSAEKMPPGQDLRFAGLGSETPLQILFTSGTTGEPKGIVHTHGNLLASLTPIEREIVKYRRYEKWVHPLHFLHTLPLSHVFGQFMGLWVAPVLGAVVHYESRLDGARLLRLLGEERISVLAAVPRVLSLLRAELLASHPELAAQMEAAQGMSIGRRWWLLRRVHWQLGYRFWAIVCGGATLPAELEGFWNTLGIALIQGYGMTETSALVTLNHPFKPARGTLGAPLPGRELRITESGELQVRGAMVATKTWRGGALAEAAGDGWLSTGDLTRRDEQGRLHYLGRTGQRLVTSAGLNVYLEDVEAALLAQPGVDAAVAVVLEGVQGPEPGAVLRAAEARLAEEAVERANRSLAAYQRVRRWWLWPGLDLPRTATGKVRRGLIDAWVQKRLLAETGREPAVRGSADAVLSLIEDVTGIAGNGIAGSGGNDDERPLESLGLDSLGRVQLQAALERASGRSIEDSAMTAARTLGDLRRLARVEGPAEFVGAANEKQARAAGRPETNAAETAAAERSAAQPANPPPQTESFLYLRWPWSAPVQLLRTLFLEAVVRPLVWLLAGPRVEYAAGITPETVRSSGPLLIVANHVSSYDAPLLLYALPETVRRWVAVATGGEMLEAWRHARGNPFGPAIFRLLTVLFNVFPLPRGHAFRRSFAHAGSALDRGYSVLLFPEGTRSHGSAMGPFRGGIGLLAQECAVKTPIRILPIALKQSRRAGLHLRPYAATVCIGPLLTVEPGDEPRSITAQLEAAVRLLLEIKKTLKLPKDSTPGAC